MNEQTYRRSAGPGQPTRAFRTLAILASVALLTAFVPGCSDDDDPTAGIVTIPCVTFAPSELPQPGAVVAQAGPNSTCDVMVVDLIVTGSAAEPITDLFATNFELTFPTNLVRFAGASELGSVLATDGDALRLEESFTSPYKIALTILNAADGIDPPITTSNLLIRLTFVRAATDPGSGAIGFAPTPALLDSGNPDPDVIQNITWFGGTVTLSQQ